MSYMNADVDVPEAPQYGSLILETKKLYSSYFSNTNQASFCLTLTVQKSPGENEKTGRWAENSQTTMLKYQKVFIVEYWIFVKKAQFKWNISLIWSGLHGCGSAERDDDRSSFADDAPLSLSCSVTSDKRCLLSQTVSEINRGNKNMLNPLSLDSVN